MNFQLTPRLEAHGTIVGGSQALPASVDVLSPCILTRRGPESDLMGGHEMTPAGALKLPLPRWKSVQGGPEDETPGGLILGGRPRPPLPRGPLLNPGCSRWQGGSRRAPGAQRSPSFKGDAQPDCRQRSAGRPSQCACASGERRGGRAASQWFPRLSGKPLPEAWQTGALRGSAWVAGLRGSSLTSPRGRQDVLRMPGVVAKG